jgi:PAS domain S-box-containing protein
MSTQIRVLIAEDSEDDTALILRELRRGGYDPMYERVETDKAMRAALDNQTWDVIICDYCMPQFDMPAALEVLQKRELDLPFILVSGTVGEEEAVKAMKAGAHDYIMKDRLARLVPAIERELREAKKRRRINEVEERVRKLSQAVEQSPSTVVITDINGKIEYVNPKFTDITGYTAEEVIGQNSRILKSGKQPPEFYKELWDAITSGEEWHVEVCNRKKNGELYWESASFSPIKNPEGVVTDFIKVAEDITERKQVEESLRFITEQTVSITGESFFRALVRYLSSTFHVHFAFITECTDSSAARVRILAFVGGGDFGEELECSVVGTPCEKTIAGEISYYPKNVQALFPRDEFLARIGAESYLGVPLFDSFGNVTGNLAVLDNKPMNGDSNHMKAIMKTFATRVGAEQERLRFEERIIASLKEKEVLLKEIHHRVKNNLQIISSLLNMQAKCIKDENTLNMFMESQNRVRSMALVHEELYQSKDMTRIDFEDYVRNLINYLFRSYGVNSNDIMVRIEIKDVFLGVDMAIPCGLIINELVSNSLKHAFPVYAACVAEKPGGSIYGERSKGEGEICISFCSDDNKHTLIVGDNGVSFPEDMDFRNTESLGLQLVNTLAHQLEGTIELDRNGGAKFEIVFEK